MKKIDIHSHILPGFDDGSSSEAESLRMLKMAAKQGVEAVIATPHYSAEYCHNSPETIRRACAELEARVREKINLAFRIYPWAGNYVYTGYTGKAGKGRDSHPGGNFLCISRIYAMGTLFGFVQMCQNPDDAALPSCYRPYRALWCA